MAGINRALQENRILAKACESLGQPCIFLSHISVDKAAAVEIEPILSIPTNAATSGANAGNYVLASTTATTAAARPTAATPQPFSAAQWHVCGTRPHPDLGWPRWLWRTARQSLRMR